MPSPAGEGAEFYEADEELIKFNSKSDFIVTISNTSTTAKAVPTPFARRAPFVYFIDIFPVFGEIYSYWRMLF